MLLPFTKELSLLSAREFMRILHEMYNVQTLFVGYDHHLDIIRERGLRNTANMEKN